MRDLEIILDMKFQNIPYIESYPNENFNGNTLEKAVEIAAIFNVSLDYLALGRDITKIHKPDAEENNKNVEKQDSQELNRILMNHIRFQEREIERLKKEREELRGKPGFNQGQLKDAE